MGYSKFVQYGNFAEYTYYEKDVRQKSISIKKRKKKFIKIRTIRPDNLRRRVRDFRRLVISNLSPTNPPALLTLTSAQTVSLCSADEWLKIFLARLREFEGKDFRYISVPEFQKRGAVHFHVLVWDLRKEMINNEQQFRYLQRLWQRGFVDCLPTNGDVRLAYYLAKYMSKSMQDERLYNQKAYRASRNVLRPVLVSSSAPFDYSEEIWGEHLNKKILLDEKKFDNYWLGKAHWRKWELDCLSPSVVDLPNNKISNQGL